MKKFIALTVIFVCVGAALPAQNSMGGGVLFDASFGNGYNVIISSGNASAALEYQLNNMSFGAFFFSDLHYLVVELSLAHGSLTEKAEVKSGGASLSDSGDFGTGLQMGFEVLGKYPIEMGGFTLFPMIGMGYNMFLSFKLPNGVSVSDPGTLSQLGILGGVGFDFPAGGGFFRTVALCNLRFPSALWDGEVGINKTLGVGPRIKIGYGVKM